MYEVASIGAYDNNHKLYEVTQDTRHGKTRYLEKSTYVVANRDADKFERYHQKQNKLYDDMKIYDTQEFQKKASLKLKIGVALGGIIGAGIPLSVFAFTKNKYVRIASVIASVIGGVVGGFYAVALTTMYGVIPKEFRTRLSENQNEFLKLDVTRIREEKHKIGEVDNRNRKNINGERA